MYIDNRKKKKYSREIFNELCLLYLVITNNVIDRYILDAKLSKENCNTNKNARLRTYYRYAKNLYDSGLVPKLSYKSTKYENYFYVHNVESRDEDIRLKQFICLSKKDAKLSNNHLKRLYRVGNLLIENYNNFEFNDETGVYEFYGITNEYYNFNDVTKRTYQRDMCLVKDVIIYIS